MKVYHRLVELLYQCGIGMVAAYKEKRDVIWHGSRKAETLLIRQGFTVCITKPHGP